MLASFKRLILMFYSSAVFLCGFVVLNHLGGKQLVETKTIACSQFKTSKNPVSRTQFVIYYLLLCNLVQTSDVGLPMCICVVLCAGKTCLYFEVVI